MKRDLHAAVRFVDFRSSPLPGDKDAASISFEQALSFIGTFLMSC
ncbi:MAG: hypothetical protein JWR21_3433 [Herminiimonas sp.]|nr:hypothetical protein [Herminiimonas sp.]